MRQDGADGILGRNLAEDHAIRPPPLCRAVPAQDGGDLGDDRHRDLGAGDSAPMTRPTGPWMRPIVGLA